MTDSEKEIINRVFIQTTGNQPRLCDTLVVEKMAAAFEKNVPKGSPLNPSCFREALIDYLFDHWKVPLGHATKAYRRAEKEVGG